MEIWEALLIAVSLCADCFACTLCSGVTMQRLSWKKVAGIALAFAVIQAGLLYVGWSFGNVFVGFIEKISHWIGFLLLLYVGGGMLLEGIRALRGRGGEGPAKLDGLKNVVFSGVATSIDALAVGVSQSMVEQTREIGGFYPLFVAVFWVTALSVIAGLSGSRAILRGGRFLGPASGHWAEIIGGLVLIGIGVSFLF